MLQLVETDEKGGATLEYGLDRDDLFLRCSALRRILYCSGTERWKANPAE